MAKVVSSGVAWGIAFIEVYSSGLCSRSVLPRDILSHKALESELVCHTEGVCILSQTSYTRSYEQPHREAKPCTLGLLSGGEGSLQGQWSPCEMHSITSVSPCSCIHVHILMFGKLPIRRRSHSSASRTVELVKREIETFALVFPNVSFSVETSKKGRDSVHAKSKARVLTIPKVYCSASSSNHTC